MSKGNLCLRTGPTDGHRATPSLMSYTGSFWFFVAVMGGGGKRGEIKSCFTRDRSDSQPTFVIAVT